MTRLNSRRGEADGQRNAGAIDDAGEEIAAEIIDAEPVLGGREGQGFGEKALRPSGSVWRDERGKDRHQDEDAQHDAADDGRLVGEESPPGEIERAALRGGRLGDRARSCRSFGASHADARIEQRIGDVGEQIGDAVHEGDHQHQRHFQRDSRATSMEETK